MKYWSKFNTEVSCETLTDIPGEGGVYPAEVFGAVGEDGSPVTTPFYVLIQLDEWSPIPLEVWEDGPEQGYLVLEDDGDVYTLAPTKETAESVLKAIDGYGYVGVTVHRNTLVTRKV